MGRAITEAVAVNSEFAIDPDRGDVLVDFSAPAALGKSLDRALAAGIPILVGTTGLDDLAERRIAAAAKEVAVLRAANTSLGVALLGDLVERAARILGPDQWDIEVVETHHNRKADAPSGTALQLGDAVKRGRGGSPGEERGRDGTGLKREVGAIGFSAIRGGTAAGDHDVMFLGPGERLILSHRAESRAVFAAGALAAARFLIGRPAGLYSMRDVVESLQDP
ncbi:MAG: 4-hydroxy-tetrahydrodipicolinate reductase [Sphingomonas sp.]|nr:4-hydroxy-tetrahydrodipicolinate reductase [Sphingomonas sp.]